MPPRRAAVDAAAIEQLRQLQLPDRPDIVAMLAAKFLEHAPSLLSDLKDAVQAEDRERIAYIKKYYWHLLLLQVIKAPGPIMNRFVWI